MSRGRAKLAEIAPLDIADHDAVLAFCRAEAIGFVVVGPEARLRHGHRLVGRRG
mgnify:CR=1 FL=1